MRRGRLVRWWDSHFLRNDAIVAAILSVLLLVGAEAAFGRSTIEDRLDSLRPALYTGIASIAGSLLGFVLALLVVGQTLMGLDALKVIRDSSHSRTVYETIVQAAVALGVLTLVAITGIFVDIDRDPHISVPYAVVALVALASARMVRAFHMVWKLIEISIKASKSAS